MYFIINIYQSDKNINKTIYKHKQKCYHKHKLNDRCTDNNRDCKQGTSRKTCHRVYRCTALYIVIKQLKCSISEKQSQFWLSNTQL